ncbi:DUF4932 domain-containing protein [Hymenobacter sp.]|jgi:hypothetical protein|uniref:DUF4932 domain-containing protein n=1 Tax=Hymenobacter sp. TaxID=1898978 RepID=UPI002ED9726F
MQRRLLTLFLAWLLVPAYAQTKLTVKVDPRFEAISLFYFLATADTLEAADRPTPSVYYAEAKRYFQPWMQHPSLNWYRQLPKWDGMDVASQGMFLSFATPFRLVGTLAKPYVRSASAAVFLDKLNAFTLDANTPQFLTTHRRLYQEVSATVEHDILESRILEATQQFFGSKQLKETVVFVDLLNNLGHNAIPSTDGKCYIRLAYLADTTQHLTDASPVRFQTLVNVVAHEAAHIYTKPFISAYYARLRRIRGLFLKTTKGRDIPEAEWENELEELLVRVCVAKILAAQNGPARGQAEITSQAERYKLALELHALLEQFTANRRQYPSLESFYSQIVAFLERKAT